MINDIILGMINDIFLLFDWLREHVGIVALTGGLGAFFTARHNRRIRAYADLLTQAAAAASGGAALYGTILSQYTERQFSEPVMVPNRNGGENAQKFVKMAKTRALDIIKEDLKTGSSNWDKASALIPENEGKWENRTAYETAWALQQIGVAVFSGIAPVNIVLMNVSDTIIDDWMICREWVKTYRFREAHELDGGDRPQVIDFHRRHGEWLFCLAVLWMRKVGWRQERMGSFRLPDSKLLAARLRELSRSDGSLMPIHVANSVAEATGIWILPLRWYQYRWYLWPFYWRALPPLEVISNLPALALYHF